MRSSLLFLSALSAVATALTKAPMFSNGQCGGKGYTGPTDCYDPYYKYDCLIITEDYWACGIPGNYHCEGAGKWPKNGEKCYDGNTGKGPACCANGPEWNCTPFKDNTMWCLQIANYTAPVEPTTTTYYPPPPAQTGCRPNWAQCGGIGWTGATCCENDKEWFCERSNDYFSMCHKRPTS